MQYLISGFSSTAAYICFTFCEDVSFVDPYQERSNGALQGGSMSYYVKLWLVIKKLYGTNY